MGGEGSLIKKREKEGVFVSGGVPGPQVPHAQTSGGFLGGGTSPFLSILMRDLNGDFGGSECSRGPFREGEGALH